MNLLTAKSCTKTNTGEKVKVKMYVHCTDMKTYSNKVFLSKFLGAFALLMPCEMTFSSAPQQQCTFPFFDTFAFVYEVFIRL